MKQYEKYKPSGIEWLGEIPEHWEVKRVKDVTINVKTGTTPTTSKGDFFTDGTETWFTPVDINNGDIKLSSRKIIKDAIILREAFQFPPNSIYLIGIGGTLGKVAFCRYKASCNQQINVIVVSKVVIPRFVFYQLMVTGSTLIKWSNYTTMPIFTQSDTKHLGFILPTLPEQTAIAAYLDTKTTAIDRKIELLTAKADKYKALRRSLINETVCRGLNPNAQLKDSGIEWIGKIPEHWKVKRFKSIANTVKGRNLELSDTYFENSLPNLSLEYLRNESVTFDTYCYTPDKNQRVTTDDMIIIWDGAGVGEILKGKDGFLSSTIAKIVVDKKKYNSKFLYHLRFSIEYILKMIPAGMGIPHLNPQVLNSFNCPCPPIDEQTEIAQYLNDKTTHIDTILTNISNQINKLTQLRKTLINDVVTGKIKVTD